VVTTLFMPLSLITGFIGMHYFTPVPSPLQSRTALIPFGLVILTPGTMVFRLQGGGWM
jgi:Mg2+ and Co2+ transporter CorA